MCLHRRTSSQPATRRVSAPPPCRPGANRLLPPACGGGGCTLTLAPRPPSSSLARVMEKLVGATSTSSRACAVGSDSAALAESTVAPHATGDSPTATPRRDSDHTPLVATKQAARQSAATPARTRELRRAGDAPRRSPRWCAIRAENPVVN